MNFCKNLSILSEGKISNHYCYFKSEIGAFISIIGDLFFRLFPYILCIMILNIENLKP